MRTEKLILFTLFFQAICSQTTPPAAPASPAPGQTSSGQAAAGQAPPANTPSEPMMCKQNVVRSYMLRGRRTSDSTPMVLCSTVKNTCCTRTDQQKMYHIVNDLLPVRTMEYASKMKLAFGKLKILHTKILMNQPIFSGSPTRKEFCDVEARKVYNFPFMMFYNKVLEELEGIREDMDEYYKHFFCVICDAESHKNITPDGNFPSIVYSQTFCKNMLGGFQNIIRLLNIDLVNYLISVQNLVDCTHYIKSFKLRFFDERRQRGVSEVTNCLSNLESQNFGNACASTCQKLQISKITDLIEGDFEFMIDAVNMFEKFFELKESGNQVSMKIRKFFQQFVIPRKLTGAQADRFLAKLKNTVQNLPGIPQQVKVKADEGVSKKQTRKLQQKKVKSKVHLHQGRMLQSAPPPPAQPNFNQGQQFSQNWQFQNQTNQTFNGTNFTFYKRTARLRFNRDLFRFYDEISVVSADKGPLIYQIAQKPIDIDALLKSFSPDGGIDPLTYNTKFSMNSVAFYKSLFDSRASDKIDTSLMYFLSDFNNKTKNDTVQDLTRYFKMKIVFRRNNTMGMNVNNSRNLKKRK